MGRGMAEGWLGRSVGGEERGGVKEEVHPGGQVQRRLMILPPAIRSRPKGGRAVIGNIGERAMGAADPVTHCPAALMRNFPGLYREPLSLHPPWRHGAERPVTA